MASAHLYGTVTCSCGARLRFRFAAVTPSPAPYRTWCYECGATVAGAVELFEGTAEDETFRGTMYVDTGSIVSRNTNSNSGQS